MNPLNHKDRQDRFFSFYVWFVITILATVFCIYFTNDLLTDAIARNNTEKSNRFYVYKQSQQQYINQLGKLNQLLSSATTSVEFKNAYPAIIDFKNTLLRNGDTSGLMKKVLDTYFKYASAVENKNTAKDELNAKKRDLEKCKKDRENLKK